ncbi:MAG: ABC transporter permease [Clostridia bacterium]|nr:ABC transporter permease [Clostridia bacterium]
MLKIQKKQGLTPKQEALLRIGTVVLALICAGIIMGCLGYNPFKMYVQLVKGALGSKYNITATVAKCIPLLIMALGVSIVFRMKFWNIGAEGQFYMGAFGATWVWLTLPDSVPGIVMIPLMLLTSFVCGGLWALVPAILKHKLDTSETLVTLMMNYIAVKWITYLQYGPWKDPAERNMPKIFKFTDNATLPKVFGVHIGWIIALVLVVVIYILMKYSKFGFEISVLGENPQTARYAGMNVTKIMIIAVLLSGGICGMAGMIQATGNEGRLANDISAGLGFTAIIAAWLAKLSAPTILLVSFLFAILLQGGSFLQVSMQIPASVSEVIQGIILFFVLASEFFANYKIVYQKKEVR